MATPRKIGVLIGSLRKGSFSRKIANAFIKLAPETLDLEIIEIRGVSFFDQDLEDTPPADWTSFREKIKACDAILFVTPEYNRSVPGALKNAIDVASRPYGHNSFDGKPAGIISTSIGAIGGFGANHHLRQSLTFLNMPQLTQPEMYLGNSAGIVGDNGQVSDTGTRDYLAKFGAVFADWVETFIKH
ncbi:chromate reductase [Ochrobactrum daejeonense]|uniref:Chromate reductase n=1 Tax=Brucella daejeonensis TaxID=659015 RepID=A0A7W9AV33_9HYPH|nr:NAD(P)H-dependent oxidoreductase [Brucella daejeonensis]MBB5701154.1 chromate reductase [Brucella daejeonensis]NKB79713.1 NAD(P)H-dependent oxidoreductase [Brucella daejeonensis]